MNDDLGKKAERKIRDWLDQPDEGYCFDRLPDQLSGFYGSKNICDFTLFKSPNLYYIESKATWQDRMDLCTLSDYQYSSMLKKSGIYGVYSLVVVLFASYKRAFVVDIRTIQKLISTGEKSFNIKKMEKWGFLYKEIKTIPNNRKKLLDYVGDIEDYIWELQCDRDI